MSSTEQYEKTDVFFGKNTILEMNIILRLFLRTIHCPIYSMRTSHKLVFFVDASAPAQGNLIATAQIVFGSFFFEEVNGHMQSYRVLHSETLFSAFSPSTRSSALVRGTDTIIYQMYMHPEGIHSTEGRTCKLHTERLCPSLRAMSGQSSQLSHCAALFITSLCTVPGP